MAPDHPFAVVEELIGRLARSGDAFASGTSQRYRVESYEPGWRLRIANVNSSRWIEIEDVRACWETFDRLGTITREDVLEPGRASAFMLALFGQLPDVVEASDGALAFT